MKQTLKIAVILAAGAVSSCGGNPGAPTNPVESPTAAAVVGVSVNGLAQGLAVGDRTQLQAFAVLATSERQEVTRSARWSSQTLTCVVTDNGIVTAREPGTCLIAAAYAQLVGTAETQVQPSTAFTIQGTVRDGWALNEPALPRATITVTTGPQAGRSVTTDANGWFELTGVPKGAVTLRAEFDGLEPQTIEAAPDRAIVAFALVAPVDTVVWERTTPVSDYREFGTFRVPFDVHHSGPIIIKMTTTGPYDWCGTYENFGFSLSPALMLKYEDGGGCTGTVTYRAEAAVGSYVLSIGLSAAPAGTRRIVLTHPR